MELKISKKLKKSIISLILYVVIFCAMVIFRFPYTINDLLLIEKSGYITTTKGELPIIDMVNTNHKTSFHYLLKSTDNAYYIITATRFLFLNRYDMSRLMPMPEEEVYKYADYFNEVVITRMQNTLNINEEKHISGLVFLWSFILFVVICNILNAYREQNI